MKAKKKVVSYSIDEKLIDQFSVITNMKKVQMSIVVEEFIRNYVISNKAEVNELMLSYWKNNIDNENN